MSTDTPTPERVTLSDDELAELVSLIRPWTICDDGGGFDHGSSRAALHVAEWVAAREQALRREAKVEAWDEGYCDGWSDGRWDDYTSNPYRDEEST